MAKLNLSQAAKAVGKNRVTIWRHINSGKVSAERDRDGNPFIDTSELLRAYGELNGFATQLNTEAQHSETPGVDELLTLIKELKKEQSEMKELIQDLRNRLEYKPEIKDDVITSSRAENDPDWPNEIKTISDLLLRESIRKKHGCD